MPVVTDIIDGAIKRDKDGWQQDRTFIVHGLSGNGEQRLYAALTSPGIPQFGDLHPFLDNVICVSTTAQPDSKQNAIARVTASYVSQQFADIEEEEPSEDPAKAVLQIGTALSTERTNKNIAGEPLRISLTTATGQILTQDATVDIQAPQATFIYERIEGESPFDKALEYSGTVNQSAIGSFDARTLLCNIDGITDNGGATFRVTYEFQYKRRKWDAEVVYVDPDTDKIHKDVEINEDGTGNGTAVYRVYPETDFSALNLNFDL